MKGNGKIVVGMRATSHTINIIVADWSHKLRQCGFPSSFVCMGDLNKNRPPKAYMFD